MGVHHFQHADALLSDIGDELGHDQRKLFFGAGGAERNSPNSSWRRTASVNTGASSLRPIDGAGSLTRSRRELTMRRN